MNENRLKNRLQTISFLLVLVFFFCLIVVLPPDLNIVEVENRNLNKAKPLSVSNVLDGSFALFFEPFLSDQVAFRTRFISMAKDIEYAKGVHLQDEARIVTLPPQDTSPTAKPQPVRRLLALKDRLLLIFAMNKDNTLRYANALNLYADAFGNRARVFSLLATTQMEYMPEMYRSVFDSERDAISLVNANLQKNIQTIDVFSALNPHKDEYIFFRTDHHWTALGSYYAYVEAAKLAGFEPLPLSDYEEKQLPDFLGYLYDMAPSSYLKENPDTLHYYRLKDTLETSNPLIVLPAEGQPPRYAVFIGGDSPYYEIQTSVKNGKTALIIKDSYANPFTTFLAPHYEKIILIDPRTFEGTITQTMEKYEQFDLFFVHYARITDMEEYISKMEDAL